MKYRTLLILAVTAALTLPLRAQTPLIPTGNLSAFPTIVQAGTHPTLTWDVTIPEGVTEVVEITPPGTITPKRCLVMDVRVLGASVKRVFLNSKGKIINWEWRPTQALMNYAATGYTQIFYNTHDKVNPNTIVKTMVVEKDSPINFGGRYSLNGINWSTFFSTTNSQYNVVALKDGDTPPTTTPLYQQPTIESFILPFLDNEGKINLGARDVIILMELTHTDRNHGGFDLQDLALLVTFYDELASGGTVSDCDDADTVGGTATGGTTTGGTTSGGSGNNGHGNNGHSNNGHGNNVDGVDSSNPGNAPFTDTDPSVDDEGGRGRRNR